jgi:hypothetical protein
MLFKTRYSQETLECFKSLIHEESLLGKITGFISNERWIYFEPDAFYRLSSRKMKTLFPVKITRVKGEGRKKHTLFSFH